MKQAAKLLIALFCIASLAGISVAAARPAVTATAAIQDQGCPLVVPLGTVTVAPNQPAVPRNSTVGIINALCDVNLAILNCFFLPSAATINCDTNADGIFDLAIPLVDVDPETHIFTRARLQALSPQLPGTAFPLACCGGVAGLSVTGLAVGHVQTLNCLIDLGLRAPVLISVSPSEGSCGLPQNLLIPGACFIQPNGSPNVTSVFAVERGNPANVVQASRFVILNPNLIDALFEFGAANAGKTFLFHASGPNGTSRNLTSLPAGAPAGCPLGNEQGVAVSFTCTAASGGGSGQAPSIGECRIQRNTSGTFVLSVTGHGFQEGSLVTIDGVKPKKIRWRNLVPQTDSYSTVTLQGKICGSLPGLVEIVSPDGATRLTYQCGAVCE